MNILFVCTVNKHRSKTAEDYFSAKYADTNHLFASAGTDVRACIKEGTTPIDEWMLEWADTIYCMERKHKQDIISLSGKTHTAKIVVLGVPDNFRYNDPQLIALLESKVRV